MSSADILTALYYNVMEHNPSTWTRDGKGQDVFILSAGHLSPAYYSVLARCGYFPVSELGTFRKLGTRLQGHPSVVRGLPGITQASGSLGQGLSAAEGVALGKSWTMTGILYMCLSETGNARRDRYGKPPCSPRIMALTT